MLSMVSECVQLRQILVEVMHCTSYDPSFADLPAHTSWSCRQYVCLPVASRTSSSQAAAGSGRALNCLDMRQQQALHVAVAIHDMIYATGALLVCRRCSVVTIRNCLRICNLISRSCIGHVHRNQHTERTAKDNRSLSKLSFSRKSEKG
jgi:hypothetical protein